jgi:hypothetical protein
MVIALKGVPASFINVQARGDLDSSLLQTMSQTADTAKQIYANDHSVRGFRSTSRNRQSAMYRPNASTTSRR